MRGHPSGLRQQPSRPGGERSQATTTTSTGATGAAHPCNRRVRKSVHYGRANGCGSDSSCAVRLHDTRWANYCCSGTGSEPSRTTDRWWWWWRELRHGGEYPRSGAPTSASDAVHCRERFGATICDCRRRTAYPTVTAGSSSRGGCTVCSGRSREWKYCCISTNSSCTGGGGYTTGTAGGSASSAISTTTTAAAVCGRRGERRGRADVGTSCRSATPHCCC